MEAKDLRTECTLSERNHDGKYGPSGTYIQSSKSKTYQDIGSSSSNKLDSPVARPCAVIGPDRVVPQPVSDAHQRKASVEPWPCINNGHQRPPEYPHKINDYQIQTRNISPRQTYQENMQRIMVPPTYSSIKVSEDFNQTSDRSGSLPPKHSIKLNVTPDNKYCEVPYTSNIANDQKSVRNPDMCVSNVNLQYPQPPPQGWPPGGVSARPTRGYGAPDMYQYPDYSSCAGPRPVSISRPHRTVQDDPNYVYPDPYCQDPNIRFKPYPNIKDRYAQPRYEYIGNYSTPYYPIPPHKYDIHKPMSTHPYPPYPQLKSLDSRMSEPIMDGYHRAVPSGNFNTPYRNPVIHPPYGAIIANCPQGKMPPYISESAPKISASNKPPYDAHNYADFESPRLKAYPISENFYSNEMRIHSINNQIAMPNYPSVNVHHFPPHPYYKKDSLPNKSYEYINNLKNMDPLLNMMNTGPRHLPHFSPGVPISPTNSLISNDTIHTRRILTEDCGYASQSSGASVKSIDSAIFRNNEYYKRYYDPRYRPIVRTSPIISKQVNHNLDSKDKKQINVRQFLQMWNEGDDENEENITNKDDIAQSTTDSHHLLNQNDNVNNHEQLYVLGLVNVPSEEISKYEHIQTVSKLPENIKGYNSIELLNQFEEAIESSNLNYYRDSLKDNKIITQPHVITNSMLSRPLSPLDVEAKISQSVIHKEVGCNFEIKPCSPKMLNVELATPVQNILNERAIEKVTNPLSTLVNSKPPMLKINDTIDHLKSPSCKMINPQYSNSVESLKPNYSLQDLESNSGICLSSLPRLDHDMELNFPEVNQQFINANKNDTMSVQSVMNDLPPQLDVAKQVLDGTENMLIVENSTAEYQKQVTKLSKFRKHKANGQDTNDENSLHKSIRTDSVIIKNPENIKKIEYVPDDILRNEHQVSPINLTSNCTQNELTLDTPTDKDITENKSQLNKEDEDTDSEIVLDFSYNKNSNINWTTQMENLLEDHTPKENLKSIPNSEVISKLDVHLLQKSSKKEHLVNNNHHEKIDEMNMVQDISLDTNIKTGTMSNDRKEASITDLVLNTDTVTNDKDEENHMECVGTSVSENFISEETTKDNLQNDDSNSLDSELEVSSNFKDINNQDDATVKGTENNDLSENIEKYIDFEEKINKNKINKDSKTLNLIENPEKVDISEFPEISTDNQCANSKCKVNEIDTKDDQPDNLRFFEANVIPKLSDDESENSGVYVGEHLFLNIGVDETSASVEEVPFNENSPISTSLTFAQKSVFDKTKPPEDQKNYSAKESLKQVIIPKITFDQHVELEKEEFGIKDAFNEIITHKKDTALEIKDKHTRFQAIFSQLVEKADSGDYKYIEIEENTQKSITSNDNCLETKNDTGEIDCDLFDSSVIQDHFVEKIIVTKEINNESIQANEDFDTEYVDKHITQCSDNSNLAINENNVSLLAKNSPEKDETENIKDIVSGVYDLQKMTDDIINNKTNYVNVDPQTDGILCLMNTNKNDKVKVNEFVSKHESLIGDDINIVKYEKHSDDSYHSLQAILPVVNTSIRVSSNVKNKSFRKNHFSPFIQKLIIFNEGICIDNTYRCRESPYHDHCCNDYVIHEFSKSSLEMKNETESLSVGNDSNKNIPKKIDIESSRLVDYDLSDCSLSPPALKTNSDSNHNTECEEELQEILDSQNIVENLNDNVQKIMDNPESINEYELPNINHSIEERNLEKENQLFTSELNNDDDKTKNINILIAEIQSPVVNDIDSSKTLPLKKVSSHSLKRSLSDSALCNLSGDSNDGSCDINTFAWSTKRKKINENIIKKSSEMASNFYSAINSNRRNSISSIYTEDNVSICILIDNDCIITEEDNDIKTCYTELSETLFEDIPNSSIIESDSLVEITPSQDQENISEYSDSYVMECDQEQSPEESWVDDVACMETVVSDDIAEDIIIGENSMDDDKLDCDDPEAFCPIGNDHTDIVKHIYGDKLCQNDLELVETLYNTPQMDVNKTLRESQECDDCDNYYDRESLERILSGTNSQDQPSFSLNYENAVFRPISPNENINFPSPQSFRGYESPVYNDASNQEELMNSKLEKMEQHTQDHVVNSCESSIDNVKFYSQHSENSDHLTSSSPEVSSTTSEEKGSSILLKITSFKGSIVSQISEYSSEISKNNVYVDKNNTYNEKLHSKKPLITKAAQKYIPPIKESIRDLKVQITLPPDSLNRLRQMKLSKGEVKQIPCTSVTPNIPKKPKLKFEDVLKNIDEIQFKMHKEKCKKSKKSIPKVVIKKHVNGSHYASTRDMETFNPDLTGRKWQPWVFIEKNSFVDKMATKKKTKAIFNHRKNTFVLAEKFQKYKSVNSATFVITQPTYSKPTNGQLKYTIKLKHSY